MFALIEKVLGDLMTEYFRYWGKAERDGDGYHLLPYHCLDVAAVGHVLLSGDAALRKKFTSITGLHESVVCRWLVLLLALHDIGKFSESFQNLRTDLLAQLQGITSRRQYSVRHDRLGNLFLKSALESGELNVPPELSYEEWQDVVMTMVRPFTGHHGVPPSIQGDNNIPLRTANFFSEENSSAARQFTESVSTLVCRDGNEIFLPPPVELESLMKKASWLMAGFVVLCDWVGSNSRWFPLCKESINLGEYWEKHALPQANKAIREAGINAGIPLNELSDFFGLFPHITTPTPLQKFVDQCPIGSTPQLFILEDVTGSGKTEAALLLASRLMSAGCGKGLFVALPTMATSNAMYDRLIDSYQKLFTPDSTPSLVLAHGARHLSETFMASVARKTDHGPDGETATAQCSSWLADNRKKALLADVGVGTLDQALLAILPARFQSLRLFGLSSHILIVDEVHAYDPYMNKLLQNLLSFHAALGGSAILISATLPTHIRRDFIAAFANGCGDQRKPELQSRDYPLATAYCMADGVRETAVEATMQRQCKVAVELIADEKEVVRQIVETANKGRCVCWIRNTVHDALAGFASLTESISEENLLLFHARFAMGDRLDIEETVTKIFGRKSTAQERSGKVLIATQVVEQSLDLDFDLLITDLAPMDLLIQRAGRLHRHPRDEHGNPLLNGTDRREPPCMIVYGPLPEDNAAGDWFKAVFPKASFVYPSHGCLWLTARLLSDNNELKMPDDARELIEAAFSESADKIPDPLQQRDQQASSQWQTDRSLAHINMLKLDEGYEPTINQWREDMKTPTRLGGMDTTVRLATWDGTTLLPWHLHEKFPWDMSQVSIRSGLVDSEVAYTGSLGDKITRLKELLPDKGKWSVLVPLQLSEDGHWRGEALNKRQEIMEVKYDRQTGATVTKKEG
ncbi:CRISPR-associated helicase Cas3' [Geobacter sp. AOG1]|uniref:CRISPR-associated helicase Cas3' n=1 Tax=Geobacter sp. AOG1 TaxID=1566346 RepID=UPI001CC7E541|nr:CRISPR-associated helicase Cas3' [Geobacter sp. AOG1]